MSAALSNSPAFYAAFRPNVRKQGAGQVIPFESGKPTRQAYPSDVFSSNLSPTTRHLWDVLCNHVNRQRGSYSGQVWAKNETLAREMGRDQSTVRRGLRELLRSNWICSQSSNAGGRGNATTYHLHPDGKPCALPQREPSASTKRPDVAEANRRRWQLKRDSQPSSVPPSDNHDNLSSFPNAESMTTEPSKHDNQPIANKEELSIRTIHTKPEPGTKRNPGHHAAYLSAATRIHQNHPKLRRDIGVGEVTKRLAAIVKRKQLRGADADAYIQHLADRHEAFCKSWQWSKDDGQFAKALSNWLAVTMERYDQAPPASQAAQQAETPGLSSEELLSL